jgi:hypothetical protein
VDNGVTWTTSGSGTGTPTPVGGGYEYSAALTPSFLADSAHHMNQYRFLVASSAANLSNANCSFLASTKIIVMVNNCMWVLNMTDTRQRRQPGTNDATQLKKLINPFIDQVSFSIFAAQDSPAMITILDNYGKLIRQVRTKVTKGYNPFIIDQMNRYSKGTYFLKVDLKNESINRILVKTM